MKKIEIAIKPFELDAVNESLSELGVGGIRVSEIHEIGAANPHRAVYRGSAYVTDVVAMMRLEMTVPAHLVDGVVDAIRRAANSTCTEDALVLVTDAGEAFRMRSGKSGDAAFVTTAHRGPSGSPRVVTRAIA